MLPIFPALQDVKESKLIFLVFTGGKFSRLKEYLCDLFGDNKKFSLLPGNSSWSI